nr:toxin co-regulated pilus biosynthesis Q family protein [Desulfovibrio sp.]
RHSGEGTGQGEREKSLSTAASLLANGYYLREGLLSEALEAWCAKAGYTLAWRGDFDYEIEEGGYFGASFYEAMRALLASMRAEGIGIRASIFTQNHVLEIRED